MATAASSPSPQAPGLMPEAALKLILSEHPKVFEPLPSGLPPDRGAGHTIPLLPDSKPTFRGLYRLSPVEM